MSEQSVENQEELNKEVENTEEVQNEETQKETENTEEVIEISELDALKAELAEQKDKYLRLYSEFDNFRKRTNKERIDLISTAGEKLLIKVLPVVDDFERAEKSNKEVTDVDKLKEGYDLIYSKFVKLLEAEGLKPINATEQEFNPDLHEALTQIPAPTEELKGKVVDEIEKGYYLGEKVVRFSKVVVGA